MKTKPSSESLVRRYMMWVFGLTVLGMSITLCTIVSIIIGFNELRYLILPVALRGTVVASWIIGLILLAVCGISLRARTRQTLELLTTIVLGLSVLSLIMFLAAGIDLTRAFTSPTTLLEHLGDAFSKVLSSTRITPKGMQGVGGEAVIRSLTHVGMSIAVMQLIGFLPFPYNVIVFFVYYKFFTALLFCLIPTAAGIAAVLVAYSARLELQRHGDHNRLLTSDESSCDDSEPLIRTHNRTQTDRRHDRQVPRFTALPRNVSRETLYQAV